jgi:hypothetical protein
MKMWGQIGNEYAVISTELPSLDVLGKKINDRWEVPHLCHHSWDEKYECYLNKFSSLLVDCQNPNFLQLQ